MKDNKIINLNQEKELLNKVTDLIQEAKPLYFKEEKKKKNISKICALFFFIFISFGSFNLASNTDFMDTLKYGETLCAQDYGFPVDSYGLIMVDDEF